jgi:phosphoribosylamine---glycine ligase
MRVLVVGSGGREHALAWKLRSSPLLGELHAAPGNPGIAAIAEVHDVAVDDLEGMTELAGRIAADLVVVGPEAPLVDGLVDRLEAAGIRAFGPTAAAARLEGSKVFAKSVMDEAAVPTGRFTVCDTVAAAQAGIAEAGGRVVIKADGLAAGKGVFVCDTIAEADQAIRACLVEQRFGESGARILIEERLEGPEASVLALCDGEHVLALAPARDAKRALDGDRGPNTGGMGCVSPVPELDGDALAAVVEQVHEPVVRELARRGTPFRGCLYAGLMLTADGPRVLEFNTRFGDPETQVILPRLGGDLLAALDACAGGSLTDAELAAGEDAAVSVVIAARGYPETPQRGAQISGLEAAEQVPGVTVFHAGTALDHGRLVAAGGRVLNVTAVGRDFAEARDRAYEATAAVVMAGAHHRTDIGLAIVEQEHQHV